MQVRVEVEVFPERMDGHDDAGDTTGQIVFTVFGRMGIIGLVIFIPIAYLLSRELWIGLQVMRRYGSQCDARYAFTWAFVMAGFVNAFFQSTFEAPYTAVMFWTLLALLCVMNNIESEKFAGGENSELEPSDVTGELQLAGRAGVTPA